MNLMETARTQVEGNLATFALHTKPKRPKSTTKNSITEARNQIPHLSSHNPQSPKPSKTSRPVQPQTLQALPKPRPPTATSEPQRCRKRAARQGRQIMALSLPALLFRAMGAVRAYSRAVKGPKNAFGGPGKSRASSLKAQKASLPVFRRYRRGCLSVRGCGLK